MSRHKHIARAAFLAVFAQCAKLPITAQQVADDRPAWREYSFLLRSSTLEWLPEEPFQLKVDLTINDLDGNRIDSGTAEEIWGSEKLIQVHTQFVHDGVATSGQDGLSHARERYLIREIMGAIARPFPSAQKQETFNSQALKQNIDGAEQSCFFVIDSALGKPSDMAYCTNHDNQLAFLTGPASLVIRRENFRRFYFHEIPMDVALLYNGKIAIMAHVTELNSGTTVSASVARGIKHADDSKIVPAGVLVGQRIRKVEPQYPKKAKKQHIQGSVLLAAVISKQGVITNLEVIASPDPMLSDSAIKAVQQWTYTPYLLKGQPTEVDTTITVNYALGR